MVEMDFKHHAWNWLALVSVVTAFITVVQVTDVLADRVEIFDVRKSLSMGPKDPIFKDYYLSVGRDSGLKEKMIVRVYRSVPVFDHARNESRGELNLLMGKIKIIYVGNRLSVGRLYSVPSRSERPVAEVEGFMIGDHLDLSEAYFEKPESPASVASAPSTPPPTAAVPASAAAALPAPAPAPTQLAKALPDVAEPGPKKEAPKPEPPAAVKEVKEAGPKVP